MNRKTRSFPHAFLRSFGLAAVVVAAVTGASTAQAQERTEGPFDFTEWPLDVFADLYNTAAELLARVSSGSVIISDDQLDPLRSATCELTTGQRVEAIHSVTESIDLRELRTNLDRLPEGSWRHERFNEFLASEDELLQRAGSSDEARALSLRLMDNQRESIERSEPGQFVESLSVRLSTERIVVAADLLCDSSSDDSGHPVRRVRWVESVAKISGGLLIVGVNVVVAPRQLFLAAKSIALGGVILASGIEDIADL